MKHSKTAEVPPREKLKITPLPTPSVSQCQCLLKRHKNTLQKKRRFEKDNLQGGEERGRCEEPDCGGREACGTGCVLVVRGRGEQEAERFSVLC